MNHSGNKGLMTGIFLNVYKYYNYSHPWHNIFFCVDWILKIVVKANEDNLITSWIDQFNPPLPKLMNAQRNPPCMG